MTAPTDPLSLGDGPRCIVCDRPIAKRTNWYDIREPQPAAEIMGHAIKAREDGERHNQTLWIADDKRPRSKADCQRLVNDRVMYVKRWPDGRVLSFTTWDEETYEDLFFDRNRCAMDQGYASARHGDRFNWKDRS